MGASLSFAVLALAACKGGGGTPIPDQSPTPNATITPTAAPSGSSVPSTPTAAVLGVAYLPDGGNAPGINGLQVVHFEDTSSNLLPSSTTSSPVLLRFSGPVGSFALANDASDALAAVAPAQGAPFTIVQSVYGVGAGAGVPIAGGYNVTQLPTSAPTVAPSAGASPGPTATPVPSPAPILSNVTSLVVYGTGSSGVGIAAGPDTSGFLGLTGLTSAPAGFGGFVPFNGQTPNPAVAPRPYVRALAAGNSISPALLRGPSDLLSYTVAVGGLGYTFTAGAVDTTLGLAAPALGSGVMAIDPLDGSKALIGQTNPGDNSVNGVTLVTGLPAKITRGATINVGSTPRSIAITAGGTFAVVGTDAGFVVIGGIGTGTLALLPPFTAPATGNFNQPAYVGCDGRTYAATNVTSVAFSADLRYLALLTNQPTAGCASGLTASVVALPFNETTGASPSPSPSPTAGAATNPPALFVQNNVVPAPPNQDYMVVR